MPISRDKQALYPKDWKAISLRIRARAENRCECAGECGLHRGRRCVERDRKSAKWARGTVVLTVAHLWQGPCAECHERGEKCGIDSHLKAMCNRCHLRYDIKHHMANAARTRDRKRGQSRMEFAT